MRLPPPLMTSDPGSYARSTILERKPKIIQQVIEDNSYPEDILRSIYAFRSEIAEKNVLPLLEDATDVEFWNNELEKYAGKTWLELPWYFAETFFYRKLLEATNYFQPGNFLYKNPFQNQKDIQTQKDVFRIASELPEMENLPENKRLTFHIHSALWGNRMDLSNYTVSEELKAKRIIEDERINIIIDDTDKINEYLKSCQGEIHFINDNVGADIFNDLILANYLLKTSSSMKIIFHLKSQPFFVSDAMPEDIISTVDFLESINNSYTKSLSFELRNHLDTGKLELKADRFWTSCLMFSEMPDYLMQILQKADLTLLKGDVNYRRLLEDRHWPYNTDIRDITSYFPSSYLVLRTLKGEIIVGLKPGEAQFFEAEDPDWLIDGKRGLLQLIIKTK